MAKLDKKQLIKMAKIAALIYMASFLIINWSDVSWIFNYRVAYGIIDDFFNPYPGIEASSMDAYFYPNRSQEAGQTLKEVKTNYTDKQSAIEIPKISVSAPIIFSNSTDIALIKKDLDRGVAYYPGSVYPGQIGQTVILGHSAPPGWPKIKYDWVFNDLDQLSPGDIIFIDLNNKQYTYIVKKKSIIDKGAEIPLLESSANNNVLTLISCWPPGKNKQRIAVQAELLTSF